MTTPKRKRGRPRKKLPIGPAARARIRFALLPEGKPDASDTAYVEDLLKTYLTTRPHIADTDGDLQKWLDAAADAMKAGDSVRTAYYAFQAMRVRALLAYQEPISVDDATPPGALSPEEVSAIVRQRHRKGKPLTLFDLADVGRATLRSDKRRGSRKDW